MLTGWSSGRKKLTFNRGNQQVDEEIRIECAVKLGETSLGTNPMGWTAIKRRIRTIRLETTADLKGRGMERLIAAEKLGGLSDQGEHAEGPVSAAASFLIDWEKNAVTTVVQANWRTLTSLYTRVTGQTVVGTSLIEVGDNMVKPSNHVMMILFLVHSRQTWKDRCKHTYEGKRRNTPASVVLKMATEVITSLKRKYRSNKTQELLGNSQQIITSMQIKNLEDRIKESGGQYAHWKRNGNPPQSPPNSLYFGDTVRTDRRAAQEGRTPRELSQERSERMEVFSENSENNEDWRSRTPRMVEGQHDILRELEVLGFRAIPLDELG
ncbi:hypothetical protein R1sor_003510 [Riccia sorocarpa]|uniref:Uncharacterized protein n=1 Tax=Riccia sorocarpa TaxID=122646 RepID=A0ABD3H1T1_9MARC